MKLAFERAAWCRWFTPDGLLERAIGFWTQSKYCHVELCFDGATLTGLPMIPGQRICFSADIAAGVRFKAIDLSNQRRWVLVSVDATRTEEDAAFAYAKTLVGMPYNVMGLARFLIGPAPDPTDELFCSAACLKVLEHIGRWNGVPVDRVDPGMLYVMATASG